MAERYSVIPLSPLRKIIATRMAEAKRTIPHFRLIVDVELDSLLRMRADANAAATSDSKISLNDCIIKACAHTLVKHPAINVQLIGEEIHQYHDADISVVVAVEGGLATPIIREANRKTLREISAEVRSLSARAAAGQLKMQEILGGSFSISNLGSYDIDQFDAIINPPQCAILAVARAKPKAIVSNSGKTYVATMLRLALSADHRTIDGVPGAAFLSTLRSALEEPQAWFV